jgi:hypothetical protein
LGARTELAAIDGRSLTAETYTRDILQDHVIRFASCIGEDFTLMQNNVRPHVARCVTHFLYQVGIPTINSPACSPDLNPIEHVCDMLGRRLRPRIPALHSEEEVKVALIEEWDSLPQEIINGLIRSMGRRMTAAVSARGGNTRHCSKTNRIKWLNKFKVYNKVTLFETSFFFEVITFLGALHTFYSRAVK